MTMAQLEQAQDFKVTIWWPEEYDVEASRFTSRSGAFHPAAPKRVVAFGQVWKFSGKGFDHEADWVAA
jgi:hypothetical protein